MYQSNGTVSGINEFMVPFHKDRGLILFLTPFASNPLVIKDHVGEIIVTDDLKVSNKQIYLKYLWALPSRVKNHEKLKK